MLKKISLLMALIIVVSFLAGYYYFSKKGDTNPGQDGSGLESGLGQETTRMDSSSDTADANPEETLKEDPIRVQIDHMTLEEKVGQMVLVGMEDYSINDDAKRMIEDRHVGGFILFKRNIRDASQLTALLNSLKEANSVNKIPLFLSVDEEGGRVTRMPDELEKLPTPGSIGATNDSEYSFEIGSILGEELKQFGFNVDFAPVLDINSNPKNPVIGDRSFGSSPGIVSRLGIQTMKGIQSQGIISVVKHFPGHGDTSTDSHLDLPRVDNNLERLESFELIPFTEAVKENADAVMVAHILLPKIDPENPASFSKTIISGILRENMKYDGVIITDDMTMGAIVNNFDIGKAAVKSVNAGSDIVLVCHTREKEEAVIEAITNAAKSGDISEDRVNDSVYRILKLKEKYRLKDKANPPVDAAKLNSKIRNTLK
jgi:beta-N-acetylhexosaminidase